MSVQTIDRETEQDIRRESRLRTKASRSGYTIMKCRSRNPDVPGYGGYMVVEDGVVVLGAYPFEFSASLDDIEDFLAD